MNAWTWLTKSALLLSLLHFHFGNYFFFIALWLTWNSTRVWRTSHGCRYVCHGDMLVVATAMAFYLVNWTTYSSYSQLNKKLVALHLRLEVWVVLRFCAFLNVCVLRLIMCQFVCLPADVRRIFTCWKLAWDLGWYFTSSHHSPLGALVFPEVVCI